MLCDSLVVGVDRVVIHELLRRLQLLGSRDSLGRPSKAVTQLVRGAAFRS
jgi:hypothetical protein